MVRISSAVVLVLLFCTRMAAAEEAVDRTERGLPFLRTFEPRVYGGGPSNWAVVQDERGVVYFGNQAGVLEYDGVRWRLIPTEKKTVVRSLAVAPNGRVYVGAVGEIGYIAPNEKGENVYVSLLPMLPPALREFADVWCTWAAGEDVFYSTASHLIRIRGNDAKVWPAETSFALAFHVSGRFFIRQIDRGLMELTGDRLVAVPGMERFAVEKIYAMLPWPGPPATSASPSASGSATPTASGSAGEPAPGPSEILIGTRPNGFFIWDGTSLRPFGSRDLTARLAEQLLYRATLLVDGSIAAATTKGGVFLIDRDGTLRVTVTKADGLAADPVMALWSEPRGGVWAATSAGITRLEVPARGSILDARRGLAGLPDVVMRHQNALYVATTLPGRPGLTRP